MTQCREGGVNDLYETLVEIGAVLAYDMTLECVLSKLAYLLGKGYSDEKVKKLMMSDLRGELTDMKQQKKNQKFSLKNNGIVKAVMQILNVTD